MNSNTKITWLGQASLYFEISGKKILVDPYLSDSVGKAEPQKHRRVPVREEFLEIEPDIVILTHDHLDHTDPETLAHYLREDSNVLVLASKNAWKKACKFGGLNNNYVLFERGTSWTEDGVLFLAVRAEHSDRHAIGVVICDGTRKYYITGDTLYHEKIFRELPEDIYAVFLPINGVGNNMNMEDGKRFCERVRPTVAVPLHWGLFDEIDGKDFPYEPKVVPQVYQEIML